MLSPVFVLVGCGFKDAWIGGGGVRERVCVGRQRLPGRVEMRSVPVRISVARTGCVEGR